MTLIDLDSKDVQNYTNKDGLIGVSDLRMLALTDDYVNIADALEIIEQERDSVLHEHSEYTPNDVLDVIDTILEQIERLVGKE